MTRIREEEDCEVFHNVVSVYSWQKEFSNLFVDIVLKLVCYTHTQFFSTV